MDDWDGPLSFPYEVSMDDLDDLSLSKTEQNMITKVIEKFRLREPSKLYF